MNAELLSELMSRWQRGEVDWNTIEQTLRTAFATSTTTPEVLARVVFAITSMLTLVRSLHWPC